MSSLCRKKGLLRRKGYDPEHVCFVLHVQQQFNCIFLQMDYKGQRLSEYIYSILTILFGGVAWIVGYVKGDFQVTFYGWAAGLALALLVGDAYAQNFPSSVISLKC